MLAENSVKLAQWLRSSNWILDLLPQLFQAEVVVARKTDDGRSRVL